MNPELGPEEKKAVYDRLKDSFGFALVSALSVVQGVALAELGVVIVADLPHFTLVRWLQTAATLLLLISAWDTITKDALIWKWVPGFQESLIPFALGAAELYLSYSISLNISYWLIGIAILALLRGIGYWHVDQRSKEENETKVLFDRVETHFRVAQLYSVFGLVLFVGLAISNLTGAAAVANEVLKGNLMLAEIALVFAWIAGAIVSTALYWQRLIAYVRPVKTRSEQPQ